jgi:hypothetical protein
MWRWVSRASNRVRPYKRKLVLVGLPFVVLLMGVGSFIGAALSELKNQGEADNYATEYAHQEGEETQRRCAVIIPVSKRLDCQDAIKQATREQQRREYEVEADRNSAVWNEAMGEAALIGGIVSILTVVLVFLTFEREMLNAKAARGDAKDAANAAERALEAANKTAKAAAGQVKIARETAYLQLRAYLSIDRITVLDVTKGVITGSLFVKNAGQTPAAIKFYVNQWIGDVVGSIPPEAPAPYFFAQHNPFVNARSIEEIKWFYPLHTEGNPEGIAALCALDRPPARLFIIYGRIEFTDYQGKLSRVLHFAYRNNGRIEVGEKFEFIAFPFGNTYEEREL